MNKGILIVISAPAGCGKDTILERAFEKNNQLFYSVSATTRAIRNGETDSISYYFKTREQFLEMVSKNELLEYTEYCGNFYGTPKKAVTDMLSEGKNVVLKIEVEGALNIKKIFNEAVLIFILPPSIKELDRRLHKRGTEDEETIQKRIELAKKELTYAKDYDYLIVNGELEKAIDDFLTIVNAEKFKAERNLDLLATIS